MSEKNVANYIVIPIVAPSAEATVLELMTDGFGNQIALKVTGDLANSGDLSFKVQEKEEGGTYADISGASGTVKPGGAVTVASVTAKYIRVRASGGARGELILSTDVKTQHISQLP